MSLFPVFSPVGGGGFSFVAHGAETAASTSFTLNPTTLGASDGDIMLVCSLWEDDSAVTSPTGWTNVFDHEAPQTNVTARSNLDYKIFSGSVPGDQTWSYGGASGVAYAWAIFSGVTGVGTEAEPYDTNASTGLVTTTITVGGGELAAVIFSLADGGSKTGETATLSGCIAADVDASPVVGRYAMVGYVESSGDVTFTTTSMLRSSFQQTWIPLT